MFELAIARSVNLADTVREVRKFSEMNITEIRRRIGTEEPLVVVSSEDHPLEMHGVEGYRHQHAVFLEAHDSLTKLGDSVHLFYRPGPDDPAEEVDLVSLENLMESELIYLNQEYD